MILFFARLLRLLFFLFLLRLVLRSVASWFRPRARAARPSMDLVRDQICNTYILREKALEATVGGQVQHFCSTQCRDRALAPSRAS